MTFEDILEDERAEAAHEKACDMAKKMLAQGKLSIQEIADISDLPEEEIRTLQVAP